MSYFQRKTQLVCYDMTRWCLCKKKTPEHSMWPVTTINQWCSVCNTEKSIRSPTVLVTLQFLCRLVLLFFQRDVALKVEIPLLAKPRLRCSEAVVSWRSDCRQHRKKPKKKNQSEMSHKPPALQKRRFKMESNAASQTRSVNIPHTVRSTSWGQFE